MKEVNNNKSIHECPNCWGYQEYDNEKVEATNKEVKPTGWISTYVKENLI